jgi:hypothetical protein
MRSERCKLCKVRLVTEVDRLLVALDAATCDAERAAVIASVSSSAVLDQLHATVTYRTLIATTARDVEAEHQAHDAFTRNLQDATGDTARLAIIRATEPTFVAEWQWQQRATSDHWMKRYLGAVR